MDSGASRASKSVRTNYTRVPRESAIEITELPTPAVDSRNGRRTEINTVEISEAGTSGGRLESLASSLIDSSIIDNSSEEEEPALVHSHGPTRKSKRRIQQKLELSSSDDSIRAIGVFAALKKNAEPVSTIVQDWLSHFANDVDEGVLDILQFIVFSCGSNCKLDAEMLDGSSMDEIIENLLSEPDGEDLHPLVRAENEWETFGQRFGDFVEIWSSKCMDTVVLKDGSLEKILQFLVPLTNSEYRALRHTSTVAALKLASALVKKMAALNLKLSDQIRQLSNEEEKSSESLSELRIEALARNVEVLKDRMERVDVSFIAIVDEVFHKRFRDTRAEIRAACMSELGVWMKYSHDYVDDVNLHLIHLMLRDDAPEVRQKCVEVLNGLYKDLNLKPKLLNFTNLLKPVCLIMVVDKLTGELAALSTSLMRNIQRMFPQAFKRDEKHLIFTLMFAGFRPLAVAAAEFFQESDLNVGRKRETLLKIVEFFKESQLLDHGPYLVDAMVDLVHTIRDWAVWTDLLLWKTPSVIFTSADELALIALMKCAIERVTSGLPPVGRFPAKEKLLPREARQALKEQTRVTEILIQSLPALLSKFLGDAEKLVHLLAIPLVFKFKLVLRNRHENFLIELVEALTKVVEYHAEEEILLPVGKCLAMIEAESSVSSIVGVPIRHMVDYVWQTFSVSLDQFKRLMEDKHKFEFEVGLLLNLWTFFYGKEDDIGDDIMDDFVASLWKVVILNEFISLEKHKLWQSMDGILKKVAKKTWTCPDEVGRLALLGCFHSALWSLRALDNTASDSVYSASDAFSGVSGLKNKLYTLIRGTKYILFPGNTEDIVLKETAFRTLCDLLICFSRAVGKHSWINDIILDADESTVKIMVHYIAETVLSGDVNDDELESKCELLLLFCKLLVEGALSPPKAYEVFKYYTLCHSELNNILKETLIELRSLFPTDFAKLLHATLVHCYENPENPDFCLETARRFASLFGSDTGKYVEAITTLHREGISYVLEELDQEMPPPHLTFFDILTEFSSKLNPDDRLTILQYATQIYGNGIQSLNECGGPWSSMLTYQNSLEPRSSRSGGRSGNIGVRQVLQGKKNNTTRQLSKRRCN